MSQNVPSGCLRQLVAQGNGRPDGESEPEAGVSEGGPGVSEGEPGSPSGQISLRNPLLPVCRNTLHPEIRSAADIELVMLLQREHRTLANYTNLLFVV